MFLRIASVLILLAATAASVQAGAARYQRESGKFARNVPSPGLKDCTRFNGRSGYYGNPWCNDAEQLRWDRWEARQHSRQR